MMPELGKYAGAVLGSYAASIALIVVIVGWSLWRAAKVKRALAEVEARAATGTGASTTTGAGKHG
ncbi:heme exporter protein CcmD [Pseudorhodobacter ferrugineus]|uniref:heme exporter protein CcmD n=1 Tax=Pseudorhodobacter ferrugineus TaxID=77008 RepID=UPI0003B60D0B|nr:heme exporter protein CcmD [Pseudorhodobacter ferrugineus]